ncbi:MAG: hypothetical protein EXS12_03715 [Phycisphaerales bacterium]|nr:hypothetical protein [Phycisphaerales bacterium]
MSHNEPIQKFRSRTVVTIGLIFLALSGAMALAQNALDSSLHVGSGGVNTTPTPSAKPVRRDSSQIRGLNPYDVFQKIVSDTNQSRSSFGQVTRVSDRNPLPQKNNQIDWKKKDSLRYYGQGLALTANLSRSMDAVETPYASFRTSRGETGNLTANGLRGVKLELDRDRIGTSRMSLYETARLREDIRNKTIQLDAIGVGVRNPFQPYQPTDAVMATKLTPANIQGVIVSEPPQDTRLNGYGAIINEVRRRFESKFESVEKLSKNNDKQGDTNIDTTKNQERILSAYDLLKKELSETKNQTELDEARKAETGAEKSAEVVDPEKERRVGINMTLDDYAMVLKHGQHIDSMTSDEKNRFNELLSEGQRAMYEGNAFVAEKRFQVALSIRPNDPLAIAGMLHCQISANLTGSAALTLHELFVNHPEMMDVRWGPKTIPPRPRLEKALAESVRRLAIGRDAAQFALLQAYIAHLLNDQDAVKSGLFALRGSAGDDEMASILRKLWLDPASDTTPQKLQTPKAAIDSATP